MPHRYHPLSEERIQAKCVPVPECGCWIWVGSKSGDGYGWILWGGRFISAHRASWIFYKGEIPEGKFVLHKCDTPLCINPDHLFIGTAKENSQDIVRKGRCRRPVGKGGGKKLRSEIAIEIYKEQGVQSKIAEKFGVAIGTVNNIKHKRGIYSTLEV